MQYFFYALAFFFGAALGSFILVVAERYNTGLPFFRGRSMCFSCRMQLGGKDLFPIFSFLFLKGRCRHCGSRIPANTLLAEIAMGFLSMLAAYMSGIFDNFQFSIFNFQSIFNFLILNLIFGTILLISIYDLKHFIIPDSFLAFLLGFSLLHNSLFIIHDSFPLSLFRFAVSGALLALPFLLIFLLSRGRWLGLGDVKYIFVIGFFLGLIQGVSAVVLAFWIGAAVSLFALLLKNLKSHIHLPMFGNNLTIKSEIPFGPFLSAGIIISLYLNADILKIQSLINSF